MGGNSESVSSHLDGVPDAQALEGAHRVVELGKMSSKNDECVQSHSNGRHTSMLTIDEPEYFSGRSGKGTDDDTAIFDSTERRSDSVWVGVENPLRGSPLSRISSLSRRARAFSESAG